MNKKANFPQNILMLFLVAIIALIIFTPFLVREIYIFNREQSETILLLMFVFMGFAIYNLHGAEIRKKNTQLNALKSDKAQLENRLEEALDHIGKINIQIDEVRSIFSDIKKYPESKKDLNYTLEYFANKVLSAVNVGWVVIKIIDLIDLNTLKIYTASRKNKLLPEYKIANKDILNDTYNHKEFVVIKSDQENLNLKVACILPKKEIKKEQLAIIKAVASRLELIYLIFSSHYYKNSRPMFINDA